MSKTEESLMELYCKILSYNDYTNHIIGLCKKTLCNDIDRCSEYWSQDIEKFDAVKENFKRPIGRTAHSLLRPLDEVIERILSKKYTELQQLNLAADLQIEI